MTEEEMELELLRKEHKENMKKVAEQYRKEWRGFNEDAVSEDVEPAAALTIINSEGSAGAQDDTTALLMQSLQQSINNLSVLDEMILQSPVEQSIVITPVEEVAVTSAVEVTTMPAVNTVSNYPFEGFIAVDDNISFYGSGNCFYWSVATQLNALGIRNENGGEYTHGLLRAMTAELVNANRDELITVWEVSERQLSNVAINARATEGFEITYLPNALQINIEVIDLQGHRNFMTPENPDDARATITLANFNQGHFVILVPENEPEMLTSIISSLSIGDKGIISHDYIMRLSSGVIAREPASTAPLLEVDSTSIVDSAAPSEVEEVLTMLMPLDTNSNEDDFDFSLPVLSYDHPYGFMSAVLTATCVLYSLGVLSFEWPISSDI